MNESIDKYCRFCECRRCRESTTLPTHAGSKAATGKSDPGFCFGPCCHFEKLEPHCALKYWCLTSFQKSAKYLTTRCSSSRMTGWLALGRTYIFLLSTKPWGGRVPTSLTVWACAPHPDIHSRILDLDIHRSGDQCGEQQVYPREGFLELQGLSEVQQVKLERAGSLRGGDPFWYPRWALHQGDGWRQGDHASSFPPEKADIFFWEIKK